MRLRRVHLISKGVIFMSDREKLKISTRVMYDELRRQNIPTTIIDARSSMLEYIDNAGVPHLLFSTISDKSSAAGHIISNNKLRTERIARQIGIPVPQDIECSDFTEAFNFLTRHKRIVLKPLDNSGGLGVSTDITDEKTLRIAYDYALEHGTSIIAQQHITGSDIRLLVIAGVFQSAVERRAAQVIGDGKSTIQKLITEANTSGKREDNSMKNISLINTDSAERYLQEKIHSVPAMGKVIHVVGPANLSLGGTAHEATHRVSAQMIEDAEKISRKLELGICGVDMMWDESTDSYALIEINATPGVNMHNDPFWGTKSNAIQKYVEWLVQPNVDLAKN